MARRRERRWPKDRPQRLDNLPLPREADGCAKKTYRDKTAAKLALSIVQATRRKEVAAGKLPPPGKGERTVYRCPRCGYWHLTSQPKDLRPTIPGRGWNGKP